MCFAVEYCIEHFKESIGLGLVLGLGLACTYSVVFLWLKKFRRRRVD